MVMNYKNIKMFFFDVDSTLYDHGEHDGVTPSAIQGLELLKKNGYKLCINTSRAYDEMCNVPKQLMDLMDCLILSSGAHIIIDGKSEFSYINHNHLVKAIKYLDENDVTYRYSLDTSRGYLNVKNERSELFYRLYKMRPDVKKYEGEEVIHLLCYPNEKQRDEILKIFCTEENAVLGFAVETAAKGCNKGTAMLKVAEAYGFKSEECCAFGDSDNDRNMLKQAGLGIAMGNYRQNLNEVADYVTDDISKDGIYNALKHFNFI